MEAINACSLLAFKNKIVAPPKRNYYISVGVKGLEPSAPWSQTTYATSCATPRQTCASITYVKIKINLNKNFSSNTKFVPAYDLNVRKILA